MMSSTERRYKAVRFGAVVMYVEVWWVVLLMLGVLMPETC
jgi:hypothetical protein